MQLPPVSGVPTHSPVGEHMPATHSPSSHSCPDTAVAETNSNTTNNKDETRFDIRTPPLPRSKDNRI